MKLTIEAVCQKGPKRDNNEDMASLGGILLRDADMSFPVEIDESSQFYLLVADGMGGHEHGERASQGLLEYLDECFKENRFHADTIENDLQAIVVTGFDKCLQIFIGSEPAVELFIIRCLISMSG